MAVDGGPDLVQLLTPEGERVEHPDYALDPVPQEVRSWYRDLVLVRRFDTEATALQRQGELGLWASLLGQEAAQIGSGRALAAADFAFPTFREHGVAWCRGVDPLQILGLFRGTTNGGWNPYEHNMGLYTIVIGDQVPHAVGYASWRARPTGQLRSFAALRPDEAAAIITRSLADGGGWLKPPDVAALLDCYGLPLISSRVVKGLGEAASAARELGYPVALKAIATGLLHKSDVGGVRLGLEGRQEVLMAAREIAASVARAGHELEGLLVQPMVEPGVELLMGVVSDESFGPVIACGAGGTLTEVLGDVTVRITPLTDLDAHEMLRSLRSFRLLEGFRGGSACDIGAVEEVLLRLSALVEAHPEVAELDANPVIARPDGALIVDARVRVAPVAPRRPLPSL